MSDHYEKDITKNLYSHRNLILLGVRADADIDSLRKRIAELEEEVAERIESIQFERDVKEEYRDLYRETLAKLDLIYKWAAGLCVSHPHLVPYEIAHVEDKDPTAQPNLAKCPGCGGPADNGNDRSVPPVPYFCADCQAALDEADPLDDSTKEE